MHPENIYGKQPLEVDRLAESTPTINRSGLVVSLLSPKWFHPPKKEEPRSNEGC
jgi:hypothetical protein